MKKRLPTNPGFVLQSLPEKLSSQSAKLVSAYCKACREYEKSVDELFDRFRALHEQAAELTLRQIADTGAELLAEKNELAKQLVALRWERRELLPQFESDYEKANESAKKELADVIAAERQRYASLGVTVEAMRAGKTPAGEIQLMARIKEELTVIGATKKVDDAKVALEKIQGATTVAPGWRGLVLTWPTVNSEFSESVATAAKLYHDSGKPQLPDAPGYEAIAEELGLLNTILPEKHQASLDQMVEMLGRLAGARRVYHALGEPSRRAKVVNLLEQLPATQSIAEMLFLDSARSPEPARKKRKRVLITKKKPQPQPIF